ncbi:MAG: mechanosensitive ion channel [Alphaproteobacteria bacterium]|nr:mechanosensitive ion channel [Alphaproteobacteria bacterium]
MDSSALLVRTWNSAARAFLQDLQDVNLYLQLLMIAVSIAVAWLAAVLLRIFLKRRTAALPGRLFSWPSLRKFTSLLPPFFSILCIAIAKSLAEHFSIQTGWISATIDLAMAWLVASAVLLLMNGRAMGWFISGVIFLYTLLNVTGFMKSTSLYLGSMAFELGKYRISMLGLVHGIVIFVIVFWLASTVSQTLENYLRRSAKLNYNIRELIVKFFKIFVYFIAFVITMDAMGVDLTALAVFGGALGVGAGLGLQRITANFVSGIVILLERSIKIGDLVEVGNYMGWVRMLQMRYTLLETFDGREVLVPNEELVSGRVTNWTYTNEHARIDISITIAVTADARLARELMLQSARKHRLCLKEPEPSCYLRQFTDLGLQMLLTFWIPDIKEGRYGPHSDVMFWVLEAFRQHGIVIPSTQASSMAPPPVIP